MEHNLEAAQQRAALYTQADISVRCRLSKSHLYNLIARRQFPAPAVRMGTRFTRWAASDVEAWLADPQGWQQRNAGEGVHA